jgi:ubiquinone/menaquinone biosynthesis C-methylase UbiE
MLDNGFRRIFQSPKKIVGEYIKKGDTVIDMGCGPGFFSIDMAEMVGLGGRVMAVDLQEHMLQKVKKKATRHGVLEQMEFHQCESNTIGLERKVDFILCYYMIHETTDPRSFLLELKGLLKPNAKILVVEPKIHVNQQAFEKMVEDAEGVGLKVMDFPGGKGGRSVLFSTG